MRYQCFTSATKRATFHFYSVLAVENRLTNVNVSEALIDSFESRRHEKFSFPFYRLIGGCECLVRTQRTYETAQTRPLIAIVLSTYRYLPDRPVFSI